MGKPIIFLTGATGGMGMESLKAMLPDKNLYTLRILARNSRKNRELLAEYSDREGLEICWGDLNDKECLREYLEDVSMVLHVAAFVSPQADYYPKKAMEANYGGTRNLIQTIYELGQANTTKFVYIGTVAETGDRMPPIHWGRVGDPIKPSMFDYYAVSKVAAERYVIESGLKYWVSLRQTGIIGPAMSEIRDAIMFHNCFDNVLEYVSDRDSGRMMRNLAAFDTQGTLDNSFWGHIYNIGGGESCRVSTYEMFERLYGDIGLTRLDYILSPKEQATRNFHGYYYEDSDKLEEYLHFRSDSMEYYYDAYLKGLGPVAGLSKFMCKLPGGQRLMGAIMKGMFAKMAKSEHGTIHFIKDNVEDHIDAYWGSKKAWEALPDDIRDMEHFSDWDHVIHLDHGYDETKPESELDLDDMEQAAAFRGGTCDSTEMTKGDWNTPLRFTCQFGHQFTGSPRLILEGGHWCDVCERTSWNYGKRAKKDKFFAQVWTPLHEEDELREYPKEVSELDV
ncbi:MAG: NAD(P)-dependent oxidoreductase [Lachnospiraceae bacterium]|nr:NAD(P)-dependent oxidoreductase [Lachnospiraceae bacterium]